MTAKNTNPIIIPHYSTIEKVSDFLIFSSLIIVSQFLLFGLADNKER
jgi:hypothetical protein